MMLRNSQLSNLRNVMEISKAVPIAAMYLALGVLQWGNYFSLNES